MRKGSSLFSHYGVPELNLTKAFMDTLEYTNVNLLQRYLNEFNFRPKFKKTYFKNTQYEQEVPLEDVKERLNLPENYVGPGRVDGVIRSPKNLVIYMESKYGTPFRKRQLNIYQKILSKEKAKRQILLLISDSEKNLENVKYRPYKNVYVFNGNWGHICEFCENIKEKLENRNSSKYSKDIFLLDQFSKYLMEMGVVSFRGFTKEQIYKLEHCDLSKPKYLDEELKEQITKLFGSIKKQLVELGFEEEGFTRQVYSPRLKTPILRYTPPKIKKDKNLDLWFAFELAPPNTNKKRIPIWQFEFVERKSDSKFFKNILDDSKNFERKLQKVRIGSLTQWIYRKAGRGLIKPVVELADFKPKEHLKTLRNKKDFYLVFYGNEKINWYEDDLIQTIAISLFSGLKFILDDYLYQ